jgi:RNA polymerase-binding transcription factor DksA
MQGSEAIPFDGLDVVRGAKYCVKNQEQQEAAAEAAA